MDKTPLMITLRYFAILREQRGVAEEIVSTKAVNLHDLYRELAVAHHFSLPVDRVVAAVGDDFAPLDQPLKNGDVITFIPPVAGG